MGYCVPAAMGAALGRPEFETWAVTGDGGFQMTSQELMTLAADRIPVKIAILDNKKLGMIRQWQEIIYAGNYHSAHLPGPGLHQARRGLRHPGASRRPRPEEVDSTIQRRPGGRRAGPHLVRDRRGAERVPDDAGGQGPVRPDRDVGGAGGMSADQSRRRHAPASHPPAGAHHARRRRGRCPGPATAAAPHPRRAGDEPARRPQPRREPHAGAQLQHRLAGRRRGPTARASAG